MFLERKAAFTQTPCSSRIIVKFPQYKHKLFFIALFLEPVRGSPSAQIEQRISRIKTQGPSKH